jgi:ABC-type lipoprotein export system ATPase subunit
LNHRRRLAIKDRSEKIIEGHGLTKIYGTGDVSTVALNKVTFDIRRGEFVLIVGQSGSGKSTMLHIIGLLDKPTAGKIVIDGIDATYLSDSDRSLVRRYKIGFIFQAYNLLSDLTVAENVMLPLMMVNNDTSSAMRRKVEMVLEKVGLAQQINKQSNQLSGGQMQRVAVARALVSRPALVLGDEPTGNLDSKSSQDVISLMKKLNKELNQTFVIVTHARESFGIVDRTIVLKDGRIEKIE